MVAHVVVSLNSVVPTGSPSQSALTVCAGVPTGSPSQSLEHVRAHVLLRSCSCPLNSSVPTGSPSQSALTVLLCLSSLHNVVPTGSPSQSPLTDGRGPYWCAQSVPWAFMLSLKWHVFPVVTGHVLVSLNSVVPTGSPSQSALTDGRSPYWCAQSVF